VITSEITFEVDGLCCAGTLYRPDAAAGPRPCVVMGNGITLTRRDGIPAYAERFVAGGVAAFAFDYRHWGGSEGEPRRWFSVRKQRRDWRAAVACARRLEHVDPDRIALWGMSMGGAHALMTAAANPQIAAAVALVPCADGLPVALAPAPPTMVLRMIGRALREAVTRRPVPVPMAGAPGSLAVSVAPEALPGFTSVTAGNGWRNEVSSSGLFAVAGYRPVRHAARIQAPVLLQLGSVTRWCRPSRSRRRQRGRGEPSCCATRSTTSDASRPNTSIRLRPTRWSSCTGTCSAPQSG
jgi:dienelactone hydrolase